MPELQLRSNAIEAELMAALERWEELGTRLSAARCVGAETKSARVAGR